MWVRGRSGHSHIKKAKAKEGQGGWVWGQEKFR